MILYLQDISIADNINLEEVTIPGLIKPVKAKNNKSKDKINQ